MNSFRLRGIRIPHYLRFCLDCLRYMCACLIVCIHTKGLKYFFKVIFRTISKRIKFLIKHNQLLMFTHVSHLIDADYNTAALLKNILYSNKLETTKYNKSDWLKSIDFQPQFINKTLMGNFNPMK